MTIRMMDQGRKCSMTGIGDAILYVQELRDRRTLELAAALVSESEESDRPAAFLSLLISRAGMKPCWTFAEAGKLPQSARDDAVEIFVVESPNCNAFLAQPEGYPLEERLYNVYKEQLEAVTVTDELLVAARKVRDQKPFKDPFAAVMAQAANARAMAALTDVQKRLAGPLAALGSLHMNTMPAITEAFRQQAITGPVGQALASLNKSFAADTGNLANWASVQLVDLAPKIVDPYAGLARFQLEQDRLSHFDAYSAISADLGSHLSPFEKTWQAQQESMARLQALINGGAIASSLYEQSERLSKQAQLVQVGLQGIYPAPTLDYGLSSAAMLASVNYGAHLDVLSAQAMSASKFAQMAADPMAALQAQMSSPALAYIGKTSISSLYDGIRPSSFASLAAYASSQLDQLNPTILLASQPASFVPRESSEPLPFRPRRRDREQVPAAPVDSDDGRYALLYELLGDDSPKAISKLDLVMALLGGLEQQAVMRLAVQSEAKPLNASRIIDAREQFNGIWRAVFPQCGQRPLRAEEIEIGGLIVEVHDQVTFVHALGCLEIISSDGGLIQTALDSITPRQIMPGSSERPLKHLQRILHEVIGLSKSEAYKLMSPLFIIRDLRSAYPPIHRAGEQGRKAFESLGYTLPPADPSACWNDIADIYVNGLNQLSAALRKAAGARFH